MTFDPYQQWLQIPVNRRPPTHYDLLGLAPFESDADRIRQAAMDRMVHVRKFQMGARSDDAIELIGELSRAFDCLANSERREVYNSQLRDSGSTEPGAPKVPTDDLVAERTAVEPVESIESIAAAVLGRPPSPDPAGNMVGVESLPIQSSWSIHVERIALPPPPPAIALNSGTYQQRTTRRILVAMAIAGILGFIASSNPFRFSLPWLGKVARPLGSFHVEDQYFEAGKVVSLQVPRPMKSPALDGSPVVDHGRFQLEPGSPIGATIDPANGTITWATSKDQPQSAYSFTVRYDVADADFPIYRATIRVVLTAPQPMPAETPAPDRPPILARVQDQTIQADRLLSFYLQAMSAAGIRGKFTFKLHSAPPGATLDARSGFFEWIPPAIYGGDSYFMHASVTDDRNPALIATQSITVSVTDSLHPRVGSLQKAPSLTGHTLLYHDEFTRPGAGMPMSILQVSTGYKDGKWIVRTPASGANMSAVVPWSAANFPCELSAQLLGPHANAWGLEIVGPGPYDRNRTARILLRNDGRCLWFLPDTPGFNSRPAAVLGGPNTLLVVVRGNQLDVYVNGKAAWDPIISNVNFNPARLHLVVQSPGECEAQFERIRIYAAKNLPGLSPLATNDRGPVVESKPNPLPLESKSETTNEKSEITNSLGMRLKLIPAGEFMMGANDIPNAGPRHRVRITRPFYLGVYEVTVGQYKMFNRSASGADDEPISRMRWRDANAFCQWLSRKEGAKYRLPTEAEWEYACRAGTESAWNCGDTASSLRGIANVASMPDRAPGIQKVGSFKSNEFGLYDMHGNAWEWCSDWFNLLYYASSPRDNPSGATSGRFRAVRGGAFNEPADFSRSSHRGFLAPDANHGWEVGFRVARTYAGNDAKTPAKSPVR